MNYLLGAFAVIGAFLFGTGNVPSFSAQLPAATAVFETSLASPISSSATSMTLSANSIRGGGSLSGYNCFTVDEGSAQAETICGTVSGTTVSSLTRGISQSTGTTTVAALQFSHRRGASVKITDYPLIQIMKAQLNGEDTIPNQIYYNNTVLLTAGSPTTTLASKYYVDNVAVAGAPDANTTTRGIVEEATEAETAASTQSGGTGARLFLPASLATSTPTASCTTACIPVAVSGKIAQAFLNLTQAFTWTNHHIFSSLFATSASSTNATTTTSHYFPFITSALLKTDSTGKLTAATAGTDYAIRQYTMASTTDMSVTNGYATSSTFTIPANTLSASSTIEVRARAGCTGSNNPGTCTYYLRTSAGETITSGSFTKTGTDTAGILYMDVFSNNSTSAQFGIVGGVFDVLDSGGDYYVLTGETSSSVNFSSGLSLVLVIQASTANVTASMSNFIIKATP